MKPVESIGGRGFDITTTEDLSASARSLLRPTRPDRRHSLRETVRGEEVAKPKVERAPSALWPAVTSGDVDTVREWLKQGVKSNSVNPDSGRPMLLEACAYGQERIARYLLLECRPPPRLDRRTFLGKDTALHLAAAHGFEPIVRLLLRCSADVHTRNSLGCTPLHCATSGPIVRALLNSGAKSFERDDQGRTPLEHASERGDPSTIAALNRGAVDIVRERARERRRVLSRRNEAIARRENKGGKEKAFLEKQRMLYAEWRCGGSER